MTGAERIRDAVAADTVLMPGVYDALTHASRRASASMSSSSPATR
jgi:hypothetical protein